MHALNVCVEHKLHLTGPWKKKVVCPSVEEKRSPNMGTAVARREISELRNGIRSLADVAEDGYKKGELESLLKHVDTLESALDLGGEGKQPASSDVGFDYQDELQRLKNEFERLNTTYHELKSEHQELKSEHNELKSEHNELKREHQELKRNAVRRQVGINIDMVAKMRYLRICSDEAIKHLKFGKGKQKGKFNFYAISQLQVSKARKIAQKYANAQELEAMERDWYGEDEDAEANFEAAMAMLKRFSHDGAHPTSLDGIPVDAEKAKELVKGIQPEQADDRILQQVALFYVDKLKTIRETEGDGIPFLLNQEDYSKYYV